MLNISQDLQEDNTVAVASDTLEDKLCTNLTVFKLYCCFISDPYNSDVTANSSNTLSQLYNMFTVY